MSIFNINSLWKKNITRFMKSLNTCVIISMLLPSKSKIEYHLYRNLLHKKTIYLEWQKNYVFVSNIQTDISKYEVASLLNMCEKKRIRQPFWSTILIRMTTRPTILDWRVALPLKRYFHSNLFPDHPPYSFTYSNLYLPFLTRIK